VKLDHVVVEVDDPERSLEFYRTVLTLPVVREAEFRRGAAPFPSVRVDRDTVIDLFPRPLWEGRRKANANHICLTLSREEFAALRRRLRAKRIPVIRQSRRNFGARGYARSIYFRDPDGVTLEARYYPVPRRR
jgi:glyoxylase I family protein